MERLRVLDETERCRPAGGSLLFPGIFRQNGGHVVCDEVRAIALLICYLRSCGDVTVGGEPRVVEDRRKLPLVGPLRGTKK
jgi:hypothetical protein